MGKLYEAVRKAKDQQVGASSGEIAAEEPGAATPERFDFLRYSLGTNTPAAVETTPVATAAAVLVRRAVTLPATEIKVDPGKLDQHLVVFHRKEGSEQYDKLAISLISKASQTSLKRVLVASANHGEGRTSVALNLACALAQAKRRVLVVDCDLPNPSAMRLLGVRSRIGLEEALTQGLGPGAAVARIMPFRFNVLPVLRPISNPVEILLSVGFGQMLETLDLDYDFILFDSSPLLSCGDSNLLVRHVDTTLLVVQPGMTKASDMASAVAPFAQQDLFGVLINRATK